MFDQNYFNDVVFIVTATFVVLLFVMITISATKAIEYSGRFKGHVPHWIFSFILISFLVLEFVERFINPTTNKRQDMLRLSSCVLSIVAVLLSLLFYHISERRSKRINILGLLLLWIFFGVVYLIKVSEKTSVSSWQSCPLQVMVMLEIVISAISFLLLLIDLSSFIAMRVKKSGKMVPNLEGVEFVHEYCSFLSKISYHWVNKILLKGFMKPLELEDLGLTPRTEEAEKYYHLLKKEIEKEQIYSIKKRQEFSLWRCIWNVSKVTIVFTGFLLITSELLMFTAPIFLELIIDSLKDQISNSSSDDAENMTGIHTCPTDVYTFFNNPFVLSMVIFGAYLLQIPLRKLHDFEISRESIRLKSAIQSCIFDKSLSLKMNLVNEGKFINHMAVDAIQLIEFSISAHFIWSMPIEVTLCLILLYHQLGKSGAMGCVLVFILVPVQYCIGRFLGKKQDLIMDTADRRLLKTNEMMEHIKLLKMYGWEDLFCERVVRLRSKEISTMWMASIGRVFAATITDGFPAGATICTFILYYFLESTPLTLGKVYSSSVVFMILSNLLFSIALLIMTTIRTMTSMQRLGDYFALPQMSRDAELSETDESINTRGLGRRQKSLMKKSLINKSFNNRRDYKSRNSSRKRIGVIKLPSNINNYNTINDSAQMNDEIMDNKGVIKIMNGTFAWHHNPILHDLDFTLEKGRLTMLLGSVGSGKSSLLWATLGEMEKLKGDQEFCKLPLALVPQRAWIMNASIRYNITFCQPFDEKLYDEVVTSCTLDTDFKLFQDGDATEIGEKGANLSGGQKQRVGLARALYQNADVYLLDDCLSALDPHVAATIFDKVVMRRLLNRGKTIILVTHNTSLLKHADIAIIMTSGRIAYQGHPSLCPAAILSNLQEHPVQHVKEHVTEKLPRLLSLYPSVLLTNKFRTSMVKSATPSMMSDREVLVLKKEVTKLVAEEERQTGATPIYYPHQYVKNGGRFLISFAFILYFVRQAAKIYSDNCLGLFIKNSDAEKLDTYNMVMFTSFLGVSIFFITISVLTVERFCLNASKNIHNKMIHSLAVAPVRFFDTTPVGRILNRMSADLYILDLVFCTHFDIFLFVITFVVGSVVLNVVLNPLFLIPAIPILVLSILLQRFYISSCRELQRLDCTTKSKILSHFSQVLSGLHIIRTSGCEDRFLREHLGYLNGNNLPLLFQHIAIAWMGYRLDLLGAIIVIISCFYSLMAFKWGYMTDNAASLAILYAIFNSFFLNSCMRYLSDLEIYSSNIQRLVEYCDLEQEGNNEDKKPHPPPQWPKAGNIQFKNVSLTYEKNLKPVVQNLDLDIPSGYKVGICGRTGSGKSTLTLGLFRLVDICKGEILLDNLDVSSVPIKDLRTRLSIIPQDPVIFSGSIRFNLDPLDTKTDEELWNALKVSQLYELVFNLPGKLENEVISGGISMSIGEKQLLCLGRVLLRNSKVLVMDEATASIDQRTDQAIQNIVKSAFKDRTVLTIAHRISTIINSNWVVVMQDGRLLEEGSPQELLKKNSHFASLVNSSS